MNWRKVAAALIVAAGVVGLAMVCSSADDESVRTPTPTPRPIFAPKPTPDAGYWHSHCARIRRDGQCDRRFRPIYHERHYHHEQYPMHTEGNHY